MPESMFVLRRQRWASDLPVADAEPHAPAGHVEGLEKLKNSTPTSLAPGVARKLGAT